MRNLKKTTPCVLVLVAVGAAAIGAIAQAADIYRWKDAQGTWQYSDLPRPGAERISGPGKPPVAKPAVTPGVVTPPAAAATTPPDPLVAQQVRQESANAQAEDCKKAKEAYDRALRARRFYKTDEAGQRVYLTDAEADATRVAARGEVDNVCPR